MRILPLLFAASLAIAPLEAHGFVVDLSEITPPELAPISPEMQSWQEEVSFWLTWLNDRPYVIDVCRVAPPSRDNDDIFPWINGQELANRVLVPLWVLQEVNKGYDLEEVTGSNRVRVPTHPTWPNYQVCTTPVLQELR